MRRLLLSTMAALALGVTAHAADLGVAPLVKAPVLSSSPYTGGWYWGLGTSVSVANSSVSGTAIIPSDLTADGGAIDGEIGWVGNIQNTWVRLAVDGSYENITGGVAQAPGASASWQDRWAVTERADVNMEIIQSAVALTGINLGTFPSIANPAAALPAGVKAGTPIQYLGAILREEAIGGTVGTATGQTWLIAPGVETGWLWPLLNASGQQNGTALDVFAQVDFPTRGMQVSGLFANGGAPVVQTGGINIGTEYRAGIHLLLP
jgi:hypothetical protein